MRFINSLDTATPVFVWTESSGGEVVLPNLAQDAVSDYSQAILTRWVVLRVCLRLALACMRACVHACVHVCKCVCARACVRVCVHECVVILSE